MQYAELGMKHLLCGQHRPAVVDGVVIDVDHLEFDQTAQGSRDFCEQRRNVVALIEYGNDNGQLRHGKALLRKQCAQALQRILVRGAAGGEG